MKAWDPWEPGNSAGVAFVAVNTGELVNRGFLNGPVWPIYGAGMVLVLLFTAPLAGSRAQRTF